MNRVSNNEDFVYKLVTAERQLEDAQQVLDALGAPRKIGGKKATPYERIDWLRDWCPIEFNTLRDAAREVVNGR